MASIKDNLYTDAQNRLNEESENNKRLNGIIEDQNVLIMQKEEKIGLSEKKLDEKEKLITEKDRIYANDIEMMQEELYLVKERLKEQIELLEEVKREYNNLEQKIEKEKESHVLEVRFNVFLCLSFSNSISGIPPEVHIALSHFNNNKWDN